MSMLARAVATTAGLLIGATTVSFVPSNEWWIRVLDFPRLQIAVTLAVVLAACVVLVSRGRWRTMLVAGLAFALVAQLEPLARERPYTVLQPQEDTWGMLLYSRFPLVQPQVRFLAAEDIPSITARIRLPSGDHVQFYGVHPRPPRPGDDTGDRDTELARIAREIRALRRPAILAGDLNDVAWSRTSRQLQQTAALRDPRVGRGLFATFNANLPAGFRWPLDHVFVSDDFALCALERPGDIGSDHFPLLVDVLLQREGYHP
ncbi:MAG: endonuclease/exonuclease/phosphatase family protein [Acidobacteria bacterium]|nr:endonuclease/exonuclease/phosphatase family protein [Acidobacteriota bacterium]